MIKLRDKYKDQKVRLYTPLRVDNITFGKVIK